MGAFGFHDPAYVLAVPDARASGEWWIRSFGFECLFEAPGFYFVASGGCVIRFGSCPDAAPPGDIGDHSYFGYVLVSSVDALHERARQFDIDIIAAPADQPWGMREMGVRTPDGHRIMFAQPIEAG
jgi:catechol 2,3-dioxygenase-like lactoylglutathione lyase family enzyme